MWILYAICVWLLSYCVVCWPCAVWPLTHSLHFYFRLLTYYCQQSIQHAKSRAWLVQTTFHHTVKFSLETTSAFKKGNMVWHQHIHHRYKTKKMVFGTQLPTLTSKSFSLSCCSSLVFLQWNKSKGLIFKSFLLRRFNWDINIFASLVILLSSRESLVLSEHLFGGV